MDRAQRLYDCITEIGDAYLQQAEQYHPAARHAAWRRWGSLAAALVLVIGLGTWAMDGLRMGSAKSEAPSAAAPAPSAPAAPAPSAPAASAPAASAPTESAPGVDIWDYVTGEGSAYVLLPDGSRYEILKSGSQQLAELGLPEEFGAELAGEHIAWLEPGDEGTLRECSAESGIQLLSCAIDTQAEVYILWDGENYLAAIPAK